MKSTIPIEYNFLAYQLLTKIYKSLDDHYPLFLSQTGFEKHLQSKETGLYRNGY